MLTFDAGVADFEEKFEVVETGLGLLEIFVGYTYFALPPSGAFCRHDVGDVS